jgi:hypothetical protein
MFGCRFCFFVFVFSFLVGGLLVAIVFLVGMVCYVILWVSVFVCVVWRFVFGC